MLHCLTINSIKITQNGETPIINNWWAVVRKFSIQFYYNAEFNTVQYFVWYK